MIHIRFPQYIQLEIVETSNKVNLKCDGYHLILVTLEGTCKANPLVNVLHEYLTNYRAVHASCATVIRFAFYITIISNQKHKN